MLPHVTFFYISFSISFSRCLLAGCPRGITSAAAEYGKPAGTGGRIWDYIWQRILYVLLKEVEFPPSARLLALHRLIASPC